MIDLVHWIAAELWRVYVLGGFTVALFVWLIVTSIIDIRANREEIACVAIKYPDIGVLALPAPARHHHVMWARLFVDGKATKGPAIQGFLTTHKRFVNRAQALKIASKRGQIETKHGNPDELYSEDMWDTPADARGFMITHIDDEIRVDA